MENNLTSFAMLANVKKIFLKIDSRQYTHVRIIYERIYVVMLDKYVNMQESYVNTQHNFVDMHENCNQIRTAK